MGKWTTREDPKILCSILPFALPDQLLTFLNPGFCSKMLTSMGCIHLILLRCGFWLDLVNKDTGWRGESGKRKGKVGVLPCYLYRDHGLTVLVFIEIHIFYQGGIPKLQIQLLFWKWPPLLVPSGLGLLMVHPVGALPIPDGFP